MTRPMAVGALAMMLMPAVVSAQDTQWNRYTLEGLEGVFLQTQTAPTCVAAGVSSEALHAEATATLEGSDVRLLTQAAMLKLPGLPELRIEVECSEGSGPLAFAVSLRMQQSAQLVRNPQVTLPEAVTWYATAVGVSAAGSGGSAVNGVLQAKLEEFAAAWTAANTKEEKPGTNE